MRAPLTALIAGVALSLVPAAGASVEASEFRYQRALPAEVARGLAFEPDNLLLGHTRPGFPDLRVVDGDGEDVPWRQAPKPPHAAARPVVVLNSGRREGQAVALLDLGPQRRVYDRLELQIPDQDFVGRVTVSGADSREGPYTVLGSTGVYDVEGAADSRSTAVVFPRTDFRYLQLEAEGVDRITGAAVSAEDERPSLVARPHTLVRRSGGETESVFLLDLGVSGVPVSALEVNAETAVYERPLLVEGSNDAQSFVTVANARIFSFAGSRSAPVPLSSRYRYLRVTVANGDDPPLAGVAFQALGPSTPLMVEPGHKEPLLLLYGSSTVSPPSYEFARLPVAPPQTVLEPERLGPERLNPAYDDDRSLLARKPWLVEALLAAAAIAVAALALFVLRRRGD